MMNANRPKLIDGVMAETIPMRGRMIHGERAFNYRKNSIKPKLYEEPQDYDIHGRVKFISTRRQQEMADKAEDYI
jgi:kynurenine 3-monooxygenase